MKRLSLYLLISLLSLIGAIFLGGLFRTLFSPGESDFAASLGYVAGRVAASLGSLPVATIAHVRQSPVLGVLGAAAAIAWIAAAVATPILGRKALFSLAIALPLMWVACYAA